MPSDRTSIGEASSETSVLCSRTNWSLPLRSCKSSPRAQQMLMSRRPYRNLSPSYKALPPSGIVTSLRRFRTTSTPISQPCRAILMHRSERLKPRKLSPRRRKTLPRLRRAVTRQVSARLKPTSLERRAYLLPHLTTFWSSVHQFRRHHQTCRHLHRRQFLSFSSLKMVCRVLHRGHSKA